MTNEWLKKVRWDEHGLVPVIAQEASTGDVVMFAWMNRDALARTAETGEAVYWSRLDHFKDAFQGFAHAGFFTFVKIVSGSCSTGSTACHSAPSNFW